MANTPMKVYTLEEAKDRHIGKRGTPKRDKFEYEMDMWSLSNMIKEARKQRNLTQSQLGKLVGVQKSQISKLEKGANSATIGTIMKVFKALKAEVNFNIRLGDSYLQLQ